MKRLLCVLCLAAVAAVILIIPAIAQPMEEFRGLYVDAFHPGLTNHEEVTEMVKAAKNAHFNALFVQVRKRGDAYYNSSLEPKAAGVAADYDPLADVIKQAHAAGLEVHAWISVYAVALKCYTLAEGHVARAHPEWLTCTREGTDLPDGKMFVDPGLPAVQDHIVAVVRDILAKYDVDGIHLDNPRYAEPSMGYNPASIARFNEQYEKSGIPTAGDADWHEWRSDQVTALVRKVHDAVLAAKPEVKLSASVSSEDSAIAKKLDDQDWASWIDEELVDFVVPMLFFSEDRMPSYAARAAKARGEREVYVGIGAYKLSHDVARKQIEDARAAGVRGLVVFSYHYLQADPDRPTLANLQDLAGSVFAETATMPDLAWKE